MSRSQRRSGNPISLFPFLAVLLCTMGSLALLLLVTTHRIRHDNIVWAEAEALAKADIERAKNTVIVVEAEPAPPAQATPEPLVEKQPEPPAPVIDLNAQLERIVTGLVQRRDTRKQELRADLAALSSAKKNVEQAAEQLTRVESRLVQSRTEQRKHISQVQALGERQVTVSGEVDEAEKRLRELQHRAMHASTKYAFVPYDGSSGTVRRPILIECTNKGMRFLPEGVTLSAADLEGSSVVANPLLAGARSLVDYWSTAGRDPQDRKPYVLLIVRPSGSAAYYAARKLLSGLDQPSGYELLGEVEELDLPAADPKAVATCRRAVEEALADRDRSKNRAFAQRDRRWSGGVAGADGDGMEETVRGATITRRDKSAGGGETALADARQAGGSGTHPEDAGRSYLDDGRFPSANGNSSISRGAPSGNSDIPRAAPSFDVDSSGRKITVNQPASVYGKQGEQGRTDSLAAADAEWGKPGSSPRSATPAQQSSLAQSGGSSGQAGTTSAGTRVAGSRNGDGKSTGDTGDVGNPFPTFDMSPGGASGASSSNPSAERRWGIRSSRASIGFQRRVVIFVDAHQLVVGNESPIPIGYGELREEFTSRVLAAIEAEVRTWDHPPEHFYWSPEPHFVVSPGGNQHYEPLKSQVAKWGLSSSVEFRLDPYKPARGPE